MSKSVDISVIVATRNRQAILLKSLKTLEQQSVLPSEIIIVDASDHFQSSFGNTELPGISDRIVWLKAMRRGAASQRNEGVERSQFPFVLFMDDDVYLQPDVMEKLWRGMKKLPDVGAISSMITNQRYTPPGLVTRIMYLLMHGKKLKTYAGRLIGPAWNLLPEDSEDLPEYVPCEWLNTTCTLYRKAVLPVPVFGDYFKGYSLMEDVTLSAMIGRTHTLWNARTARIYHDSQPGEHKNNRRETSRMQLVNRYYVMTTILKRTGLLMHLRLLLLETFGVFTGFSYYGGHKGLFRVMQGKLDGVREILKNGKTVRHNRSNL